MEIYADGADFDTMLKLNEDPDIAGFTTNPTLMKEAGVKDYEQFARSLLFHITEKPISFEVFADERAEMERQALRIADWGNNVYVKIPIMNTQGYYNLSLMSFLSGRGVKVNATALTEISQINDVIKCLHTETPSIVSIFAGRIADTGTDPSRTITFAWQRKHENQKILWASTREVYNIIQAREAGADIITATPAILSKMKKMLGKNLLAVSQDTVRQFYKDALESGFSL